MRRYGSRSTNTSYLDIHEVPIDSFISMAKGCIRLNEFFLKEKPFLPNVDRQIFTLSNSDLSLTSYFRSTCNVGKKSVWI